MIQGLTLTDLAVKIVEDAKSNRDFVADTSKVLTKIVNGAIHLEFSTADATLSLEPNRHALQQIATHTDIPWKYAEKMLSKAPGLLAHNIGRWFDLEPSARMLRARLNGTSTLRAFLSNKFRPLDYSTMAEMLIPILTRDGWRIESAQITDLRFYLQAVNERLSAEIRNSQMNDLGTNPDRVQAMLTIQNSEVGAGALMVAPGLFREVCRNGMTAIKALRRNHVGARLALGGGGDDDVAEYFTDETRQLTDAAIWNQVRDVVTGSGNGDHFLKLVQRVERGAGEVVNARASDVVEIITKSHGLKDDENQSVLEHLIRGGDMSLWGLCNAVTSTANTVTDYDRAIELQRIGSDMLDLNVSTLLKSLSKN